MEAHEDDYVVFVTNDDKSKLLLEKFNERIGVYNKFGIRILFKKVSEDDLPEDIDAAPTACVKGRNIVGGKKILELFNAMVKARMPKRKRMAAPDPDDVAGYMNRMIGAGRDPDSLEDRNSRDSDVGDDGDIEDLSRKMNAEAMRRKQRNDKRGGGRSPSNVEDELDNVGDDEDDEAAQMNIDKNGAGVDDYDMGSDEMDNMLKQLINDR